MSESLHQYSASDKEIYDLLMSGKQRITEPVLLELGRDRGIFYSSHDSRESLVDHISTLIHDYYDVSGIVQKRETSKRAEKITSLTLDAELTNDEIREIALDYQNNVVGTEAVHSYAKGSSGYVMAVEYDEYDYSRTRLIQRQRKDAHFEFKSSNGKTMVRMPATEKARTVIKKFKDDLEGRRKKEIKTEEIELTSLSTPDSRTKFFLSLLDEIPGYSQVTVINLKVSSSFIERDEDQMELEEEEEERKAAEAEILSVVRNVALSGNNLVSSPEFQQLRRRDFFITSIAWRARQIGNPFHSVQFDIGFDLPHEGRGFKYGVRYAPLLQSGELSKNFRPVPEPDRTALLEIIERHALVVLKKALDEAAISSHNGEDQ